MKLSSGQRFLYTRVVILALFALAFATAFVGLKGFPLWYGGFVLCFWGALGLLNYGQHSSLWLLHKKWWVFVLWYGAVVGVSFLADTYGLNAHLWFYPQYQGSWLLWVWLVFYPFGSFAILELLYFLAGFLDEPLRFKQYPQTRKHRFFDTCESILFLLTVACIVLGAVQAGWGRAVPLLSVLIALWIVAGLIKLRFHIVHPTHYLLIFLLTIALATLSFTLPGASLREWVYLETPVFSFSLFGIPSWVWLGSFWQSLITLRLWIFLVLHPKVK